MLPVLSAMGWKRSLSLTAVNKALEEQLSLAARTRFNLTKLYHNLYAHLNEEETLVMSAMMKRLSSDWLRALDSFMANPHIGFCSKSRLIAITVWWFGNIMNSNAWTLLRNFIRVKEDSKKLDWAGWEWP